MVQHLKPPTAAREIVDCIQFLSKSDIHFYKVAVWKLVVFELLSQALVLFSLYTTISVICVLLLECN